MSKYETIWSSLDVSTKEKGVLFEQNKKYFSSFPTPLSQLLAKKSDTRFFKADPPPIVIHD